jgi:DNA polymerase III subunit gamma/tau
LLTAVSQLRMSGACSDSSARNCTSSSSILAERRYADVFHFVQRVIDEGYDLTEFYKGLADALRALLIVHLEGVAAAEVREDLRQDYTAVANRFERGDLLRMLSMVAELDTEGRFRKSANPRTMLEALLLRWAFLERIVDVESLLRAAGGEAPVPLADGAADSPRHSTDRPAARAGAAKGAVDRPQRDDPVGTPTAQPSVRSILRDLEPGADVAAKAARSVATAVRAASSPLSSVSPMRQAERALQAMLHEKRAPHGLAIFLKAAHVEEAEDDNVVLQMPAGPGAERLTGEGPARTAVEEVLSDLLGRPIRVSIRVASSAGRGVGSPEAPQRITPERVKSERLAALSKADPGLRAAVEAWDLELLD